MLRAVRIGTLVPALVPALGVLLAGLVGLALPAAVAAHGEPIPAPDAGAVLAAWRPQPVVLLGLTLALVGYLLLVRRVDAAHPATRVPRRRIAAWLAGLAAVAAALLSPLEAFAGVLFSAHMVQHLLLTMVAPPLLALGAPVTLLLRWARPGLRRGVLLPLLHSRPVRAISFPPVAWLVFAVVMWASHFSPLFEAALEDELAHGLEHGLYLISGLLFWWPVVGTDPVPWRMGAAARVGYLLLAMPQSAFLGLAIYSAPAPLYAHYALLERAWGPPALVDQQIAGGLMWGAGDLLIVGPLLLAVAAWFRHEEEKGRRLDARLDRERALRENSR
ncbi:MAG TPA: cytochrome c oxidase assembly protein [Candidatus Limnocylindrales bacterium]|nr:cytochrome c oxidase assembly protein [Candidatus Limnocylindrales bacterium]